MNRHKIAQERMRRIMKLQSRTAAALGLMLLLANRTCRDVTE
jgi:hypothetical protein